MYLHSFFYMYRLLVAVILSRSSGCNQVAVCQPLLKSYLILLYLIDLIFLIWFPWVRSIYCAKHLVNSHLRPSSVPILSHCAFLHLQHCLPISLLQISLHHQSLLYFPPKTAYTFCLQHQRAYTHYLSANSNIKVKQCKCYDLPDSQMSGYVATSW